MGLTKGIFSCIGGGGGGPLFFRARETGAGGIMGGTILISSIKLNSSASLTSEQEQNRKGKSISLLYKDQYPKHDYNERGFLHAK